MSMYYALYLGYLGEDDKIVPLGPFDDQGNLNHVLYLNYHEKIDFINDFEELTYDKLSDSLKVIIKDFHGLKDEPELEAYWQPGWHGVMDLDRFVAGNTTPNKFIKSGYWKIDDISQFLQLSPRDREIYLLDSMLPKPLSPEAYAAEVSVNPEMVKKYVFYAVCDTNNENYYRYLVHVKSANLVDNWEYRDRKYVIYYEFS